MVTWGGGGVEGDLRAVGAVHGATAAPDPEGVQAVGLQVTDYGAGAVDPLGGPPGPRVHTVLLRRGWGLAPAPKPGWRIGRTRQQRSLQMEIHCKYNRHNLLGSELWLCNCPIKS